MIRRPGLQPWQPLLVGPGRPLLKRKENFLSFWQNSLSAPRFKVHSHTVCCSPDCVLLCAALIYNQFFNPVDRAADPIIWSVKQEQSAVSSWNALVILSMTLWCYWADSFFGRVRASMVCYVAYFVGLSCLCIKSHSGVFIAGLVFSAFGAGGLSPNSGFGVLADLFRAKKYEDVAPLRVRADQRWFFRLLYVAYYFGQLLGSGFIVQIYHNHGYEKGSIVVTVLIVLSSALFLWATWSAKELVKPQGGVCALCVCACVYVM